MGHVVWSPEERQKIEAIVEEFNPATHELTAWLGNQMAPEEWGMLCDWKRRVIRLWAEAKLMLQLPAMRSMELGLTDEKNAQHFNEFEVGNVSIWELAPEPKLISDLYDRFERGVNHQAQDEALREMAGPDGKVSLNANDPRWREDPRVNQTENPLRDAFFDLTYLAERRLLGTDNAELEKLLDS